MLELTEDDLWEGLTVAERKEIDLADFAWPEERKFPIDSQEHLDAAAKLIGRAPEAEQPKIKARAIRIAKRHGFTLPDSWQDEEKKESAFQAGLQESARPQKKIGSLKICWLEYNARSLNGRIYPKATCDAIFKAAQEVLSNPNAMPPTTFVSHEAANGNVNTDLVGGPKKVWQEGSKFWTVIDLADTSVARDMLGLAEGEYLKSASMRVAGVELLHDRNYDLPLVVVQEGVTPQFLGIDLTTRPGLADSARITQVLYESAGQPSYMEEFTLETCTIESREEPPAMTLPLYQQIILSGLEEAFPSKAQEAHGRVHDHLAGVLDEVMGAKHGQESARYHALIEGQLDEAGRAIAKKHSDRLIAAHDEAAKACAMECVGVYGNMAPSDPDNDGDNPAAGYDPDQDGESHKTPPALQESKEKTLTPEEMIAALKAQGFQVEAPKTAEQKRIEEQDAKIAALEARFVQMSESAPGSQRQTLSNSSQLEESNLTPEQLYQEGDYLKGDLAPKNWRALANPRVPWPKDLHPTTALKELAPFLTHRLLQEEAASQGRSLEVEIGLNGNL